ncbi:MAG: hypothetical protein JRM80_00190 [Nitrososphaerota archaeon]|nr:hypothetical protein [Nitrososphaerota archaeon]
MVAKYIAGSIVVDGATGEPFWAQVPQTAVQLAPSNQFGGKETSVSIQAANNGTWLFLFAKWTDPTEDRMQMKVLKGNLTGQYFTNSTYYYGDLFFANWWIGSGAPDQQPFATSQPGGGGKPSNWGVTDKQNIWNWRSYYTDQGSPGYPNIMLWPAITTAEKYSFGSMKGQTIVVPHSWAWDLYMNKTGNYLLDNGMFHSVSCVVQTASPYVIYAKGVWSNGIWNLEIARPFAEPTSNQPYTVSLQSGQSYSLSFATADGGSGEVQTTNSISPWLSLSIEAPPQSFPSGTLVYGLVVVAVAIVAVALVSLVRLRSRRAGQKPKS